MPTLRYVNADADLVPIVHTLAGAEVEVLALDGFTPTALVRDTSGGVIDALGEVLQYTSPSTKHITNGAGLLESGDTLRCDHDAATLRSSSTVLRSRRRRQWLEDVTYAYPTGEVVRISRAGAITDWMLGRVVSSGEGGLVVDVSDVSGAFEGDDWWVIVARGVLMEPARTNLLLHSTDFATTWTTNSTVETNTTVAPDGTTTADTLSAASGTGYIRQLVTLGLNTVYNLNGHLRQGTSTRTRIYLQDAVSNTILHELELAWTAGVPSLHTGSPSNLQLEQGIDGWWRVSFAVTSSATNTLHRVAINPDRTGSGASMHAWGFQLTAGFFPTSTVLTEGSQVTRNADDIWLSVADFPNTVGQGTMLFEWSFTAGQTGVSPDLHTTRPAPKIINDARNSVSGFGTMANGAGVAVVMRSATGQRSFSTGTGALYGNQVMRWGISYDEAGALRFIRPGSPTAQGSGDVVDMSERWDQLWLTPTNHLAGSGGNATQPSAHLRSLVWLPDGRGNDYLEAWAA